MSDTLHIHVCTKDRPDRLAALLQEIGDYHVGMALDRPVRVYVYDDSVDPLARAANRRALSNAPYHCVYIDEARRSEWLRDLPWPTEAARRYADYGFKKFGRPEWDPAGVRAFAQFTAACTAADDQVLFLDDDIRLGPPYSLGGYRSPVARRLSERYKLGRLEGARYAGQRDDYLVEDLRARAEGLDPVDGRMLIDSPDGGETLISGAFMLLHGADLRVVPPPHCYNEDTIFVTALAAHGRMMWKGLFPTAEVDHGGYHTDPTFEAARRQLVGYAVHRALYRALHALGPSDPRLTELAVSGCEPALQKMRGAWRELLEHPGFTPAGDIDRTVIQRLIDEPVLAEAQETVRDYLEQWTGWRELVGSAAVSEHLRQAVEKAGHADAELRHLLAVGLPPGRPTRAVTRTDPLAPMADIERDWMDSRAGTSRRARNHHPAREQREPPMTSRKRTAKKGGTVTVDVDLGVYAGRVTVVSDANCKRASLEISTADRDSLAADTVRRARLGPSEDRRLPSPATRSTGAARGPGGGRGDRDGAGTQRSHVGRSERVVRTEGAALRIVQVTTDDGEIEIVNERR